MRSLKASEYNPEKMAVSTVQRDDVARRRYIPQTQSRMLNLPLEETAEYCVQRALERIIINVPPTIEHNGHHCHGLFSGPTALAYLFLKASAMYPVMKVRDRTLRQWADLYIGAPRLEAQLGGQCGLMSERAGLLTVKTMLDRRNAESLLGELKKMLKDTSNPHELFYGLSGLLYMIRVVESWVSDVSLVDFRIG